MASAELAEMIYSLSKKPIHVSKMQDYWELYFEAELGPDEDMTTCFLGTFCVFKSSTTRQLVVAYANDRAQTGEENLAFASFKVTCNKCCSSSSSSSKRMHTRATSIWIQANLGNM